MATATERIAAKQTATATLRIRGVAAAINFYEKAFGASEIMRFEVGDKIPHAEIVVGNSVIMLAEENPDYGFLAPEALGGSPASINLFVDDADALMAQAVNAGARIVMPMKDQFYGDRSGQVADPFGYTWIIATHKEDMTVEEMHRRMGEMMGQQQAGHTASDYIPKGFRTLTPYLNAKNARALIDFMKQVFGAEQTFITTGSAGGIHAEVRLGDSMLMVGGGAPDLAVERTDQPMAFHVMVENVDDVYQRAQAAGCTSLQAPADQPWGERTANVKDPHGNHWYLGTRPGETYSYPGLPIVQPYLQPRRAEPVINFLKRAFGATEAGRTASPEGVIHHAMIQIGSGHLEITEADGPYQPMPSMFYLYFPDVDATYRRALGAGATSISEPADQPYGDRTAGVKDVFGNQWYLATHIRDV